MAEPAKKYASAEEAYADKEAIRDCVMKKYDEWKRGREAFLRPAYRNILFYRGQQWIKWDKGGNRYRPANLPHNTPTPVTNIFASTIDALVSVFGRIEPQLNFRPGVAEEPEDRATADVSARAIDVIEDEVKIRLWRQILAVWVGLTGAAWLETGYDPSPIHGTKFMQVQECPTCGYQHLSEQTCPTCGTPMEPAVDELGEPVGEQVPIGKMYVDVCTKFEMFYDYSIPMWPLVDEYIREKSVSLTTSEKRWPDLAGQIVPNVTESGPAYMASLPLAGPPVDQQQQQITGMHGQNTKVTEKYYWRMPDATYPDGLLAVLVGTNLVAYAGPLPYSAPGSEPEDSRRYFLPSVHFPQKLVPGTGDAKTVADDLAPKQTQRNQWESCVQACGMRMGSPIWLRPKGANVTNLTGDPGNIVDYNAVGPNAAKPERIPGAPIPVAMVEWIDRIDKSFEELAATFDVIKGARPEGVSAGIALQILQERNLGRYGPLFILWENSWAEWARQAIEIFRQFATEPRLLRIKGRDGRWQVQKFMAADIQGHIDVVAEASSSNPRSTLLDKAEMEQLAGMKVIDLNDPEIKYKFLEVYGRTNLTPTMALDAKNAIMENEEFEKIAQHPAFREAIPDDLATAEQMDYLTLSQFFLERYQIRVPKVRASIDDHSIHAREMRAKAKSESFRAWPPMAQLLAEKHAEYHQQLLIAQAQALATGQSAGSAGVPGGFMQSPSPFRGASGGAAMGGQMKELAQSVTQGGQHTT